MNQTQKQDGVLPFVIRGQYVKDLSFENPNPLKHLTEENDKDPDISIDIQAKASAIGESTFEVVLEIHVDAKRDNEQMFLTELSYAGIVTLGNVAEEQVEPLLLIHCPSLLFPFARNIIADLVQGGGFAPLMLAPVDFSYLYQQQKEATHQKTN